MTTLGLSGTSSFCTSLFPILSPFFFIFASIVLALNSLLFIRFKHPNEQSSDAELRMRAEHSNGDEFTVYGEEKPVQYWSTEKKKIYIQKLSLCHHCKRVRTRKKFTLQQFEIQNRRQNSSVQYVFLLLTYSFILTDYIYYTSTRTIFCWSAWLDQKLSIIRKSGSFKLSIVIESHSKSC